MRVPPTLGNAEWTVLYGRDGLFFTAAAATLHGPYPPLSGNSGYLESKIEDDNSSSSDDADYYQINVSKV
ncbi:hypothetical protein ACOSQ3_032583 [Xanthoceras sorbifolium]